MNQVLYPVDAVKKMIASGQALILAGDEKTLRQLPAGRWIGGTIPYFVGEKGGEFSQDKILVTEIPAYAVGAEIGTYTGDTIQNIYRDSPANGLTFVLIPGMSPTHLSFALNAPRYEKFGFVPLVGWITGVNLADLGKTAPKAFSGQGPTAITDGGVAMRVTLPKNKIADVGIINIFEPGGGDALQFEQDGFSARDVLVNGKKESFAAYLKKINADTKPPLVANYAGAMINVSFQSVDEKTGEVKFYAPVFQGVTYKLASPVADYVGSFTKQVAAKKADQNVVFSCNCILNYLYSSMEGKKTGNFVGPITFGEVAYQLLNQTLVYVNVTDVKG